MAAAASSAPSARNILSHIERLLEIRAIGISFEYGRKVHQNRLLRLAREGAQTASRILKERSNNSQCRAALKDFQPNQTIEFEPGRTRSRRLSGEHPRGTELKADLCLGGVPQNGRVNFLDPNSVKCQECLSRTIQWMSIPLAGVRHELSEYAGLFNKLGFRQ